MEAMPLVRPKSTAPVPLPKRAAPGPLDRQSSELMGYLETLTRKMMTRAADGKVPDCSREEIRVMVMLGVKSPRTMSDLAHSLGVPLSTATHTVGRLVEKGIVSRHRSEADRRVVEIDFSAKGKRMQEGGRQHRLEMARSWLAPLTRGEREIFLELMAKITRAESPGPEAGT